MTGYTCDVRAEGGLYRLTWIGTPGGSGEVPLHTHPYYELHTVRSGLFRLTAGGAVYTLPAGAAGLVAPGVYHRRQALEGAEGCVFGLLPLSGPTPLGGERPFLRVRNDRALCAAAEGLRRELETRSPGCREAADACSVLLVITVLREVMTGAGTRAVPENGGDGVRASVIDSYFADHMAANPSAGELAARLGVTTRQLERIMRRLYGVTFSRRLSLIRLSNAKHLLLTEHLTVAAAAARCGYGSAGALGAAFRAETGLSPRRWEKSQNPGGTER